MTKTKYANTLAGGPGEGEILSLALSYFWHMNLLVISSWESTIVDWVRRHLSWDLNDN